MTGEIKYNQYLPQLMEQLPRGAFLNTRFQDEINTMTIGWGNVGICWSLPVFTVLVRYSRHTYRLLDQALEFSVSVPLQPGLEEELKFCGTRSGRDTDKFNFCGITARPGLKIQAPIVGECQLHYECRVVHSQAMEPGMLAPRLKERFYTNPDYHVLYYGEILTSYLL